MNRDSGIEIPDARMPTIGQRSIQSLPQQTAVGTVSSSNDTNNGFGLKPTDHE